MKTLYKFLAPLNIPKFIIVNKEGRRIMKAVRKDRNRKWRPPGKLYKNKVS